MQEKLGSYQLCLLFYDNMIMLVENCIIKFQTRKLTLFEVLQPGYHCNFCSDFAMVQFCNSAVLHNFADSSLFGFAGVDSVPFGGANSVHCLQIHFGSNFFPQVHFGA